MKSLTLFIVLSAIFAYSSAANVVCYFASWTVYRLGNGKFEVSNIDPSLCTHVMFGFIGLDDSTETVSILDPWESDDDGLHGFHDLVALKEQNPNLKVMVSMGGWNEGSEKYSKLVASPTARGTLIASLLEFLEEHSFDGFDLDWEYPGRREGADEANDKANFVTFLRELSAALKPKYLLSIAVTGGDNVIDISNNVPALNEVVDFFNVMTYDFHGSFESFVGHHAPLYASHLDTTPEQQTWNVAGGIEAWLARGADPSKIHMGIGLYGRGFTLADASNAELYAPTNGGTKQGPYTQQEGILGYNEICELHSDWTYVWDDEQKVPHRVSGTQWVGYDDVRSIQEKVAFAESKNLGGYMVWSLDTDDFRGLCGDGPYPLLSAIHAAAVAKK